jgi:hypothetical protein
MRGHGGGGPGAREERRD